MKVSTTMTRNVVCVAPNDSLRDAYNIMSEWTIRHLPVLVGNVLVGILSDRDVLLHAKRRSKGEIEVDDALVSEAMTTQPMTCSLSSDVASVAERMLENKIDSLPVTADDGTLIGLVTSSDLLQLLVEDVSPSRRLSLPFQWRVYPGAHPGMQARL